MKHLIKYELINGTTPSYIIEGGYFTDTDGFRYGIATDIENLHECCTVISDNDFRQIIHDLSYPTNEFNEDGTRRMATPDEKNEFLNLLLN